MKKNQVIVIVLLVIVGVGVFFAGMKYQQNQRGQFIRTGGVDRMRQFQQGVGQNIRAVSGEILSQDDKSITVKMQDGSSKIVLLTDKTSIIEATASSTQNLKTGEQVLVSGSENSDGSVTAQNIQLNPQLRGNGLIQTNR